MRKVYLVGSMRNPEVLEVARQLRAYGFDVFDDWISPGADTDEEWYAYEKQRGRSFTDALQGEHAQNVFQFDKRHIDAADLLVLILPAGKSAHMELGYAIGQGKPGYILLDGEPERFDVMYAFATGVCNTLGELMEQIG